jgi:hypothetical protein
MRIQSFTSNTDAEDVVAELMPRAKMVSEAVLSGGDDSG